MRWLLLVVLLALPQPGACETIADGIRNVVESLDLSEIEDTVDATGLLPSSGGLASLLGSIASGEVTLSFEDSASLIAARFFGMVRQSLWRLARLAAPVMLWSVFSRLSDGGARVGKTACSLCVCVFLAQDLSEHAMLCRDTVTRMADSMQGLFPILLTLMTAVGSSGSSTLMQPAVVAAAGSMTALISNVTLPLAMASAMLIMLTRLGEGVRVDRLAALAQQAASWTLGICFTVFIAVLMTRGVTAAAIDGVTIRTAKYAINHFIPVVGGLFADTVDTLIGSSLLVQGALGVTGLIIIAGYALGPMCQTLAVTLLYRLTAALMQPVADGDLSACIHDFSGVLMLFFIIQLCVGAMFLLLIAQLVAVSGMTVMLR